MTSKEILKVKPIFSFTVLKYEVSGYFERSDQGNNDFIYSYDPEIEDKLDGTFTTYWGEESFIHFALESLKREPYDDEAFVVTKLYEIK